MTKLFKIQFNNFFVNFINNLLIALTMNRSLFKNNLKFIILLILGLIASIFIRIDFNFNFIIMLPDWINLLIRFISVLYNLYIIFSLIIILKQVKDFTLLNHWYNNIYVSIIYYIYNIFIIFITLFITYINYRSLNLLNIDGLNDLFLFLIVMTILLGLSLTFIFESKFNNDKKINLIFKYLLASSILFYFIFLIIIKYPYIFDYLHKFELFKVIHCEGNAPSNNELNNRLRGSESGNEISNNSNIGQSSANTTYSGNSSSVNVVGDNTTVSNITINPTSNNNTPIVNATRTVTRTTTDSITNPVTVSSNSEIVRSNLPNPVLDENNENPPRYTNELF